MSTLEVWIIILLVVGVVASNLAALKYSTKFKLPQFGQQQNKHLDSSKTRFQAQETDKNTSALDAAKSASESQTQLTPTSHSSNELNSTSEPRPK